VLHALIRLLQGIGADIHDVADRIEHAGNSALSEAEMKEIYNAGIKEGVRQVEQKMRLATTSPSLSDASRRMTFANLPAMGARSAPNLQMARLIAMCRSFRPQWIWRSTAINVSTASMNGKANLPPTW